MKSEKDVDGNVRYVEVTNTEGIHYTHMTTKQYREKFGYWNYHMDCGTKMLDPIELLAEISVAKLDTKIQGIRGESLLIHPCLFNKGKALVSAFVHKESPINLWMGCKQRLLKRKDNDFLACLAKAPDALSKDLQFIWAVLNASDRYSQDVNELTEKNCYSEILSKKYAPYRCWNDQNFLIEKAKELGGIEHYQEVFLAAEYILTHESREMAVLKEREYFLCDKLYLRLLNEEDKEILLKKWKNALALTNMDKALDTLLEDWNNLKSTKKFLENEFHELNQEDKRIIEMLVKENLALGIERITADESQKKEANRIWRNRAYRAYKDKSFSNFAGKHYPSGHEVKDLINHLTRERIQQLEGMIAAMNNFMDNIV